VSPHGTTNETSSKTSNETSCSTTKEEIVIKLFNTSTPDEILGWFLFCFSIFPKKYKIVLWNILINIRIEEK